MNKFTPSFPIKAVLFDLDDTLFDHSYSSRCGLDAVRQAYPCFQPYALDDLFAAHSEILEKLHLRVLQGAMTIDESRAERFRHLFQRYGGTTQAEEALLAAQLYRDSYLASRQVVAGARKLLEYLHGKITIAIITNNLVAEQLDKLQHLQLAHLIDVLVIAEEVGITKPDPAIFQEALRRVNCGPTEALMIGDSWSADILGATGAGIRSLWLNRAGIPCPNPMLASELAALEPLESVLRFLTQVTE